MADRVAEPRPTQPDDPDAARRARATSRTAWGMLLVAALALPAAIVLDERRFSVGALAFGAACYGAAALLSARRATGAAAWMVIAPTSGIILASMVAGSGLHIQPFFLVFTALLASILLPPRQIWVVLGMNLVGLMLALRVLPGDPLANPLELQVLAGTVTMLLLASVVGAIGVTSVRNALRSAAESRRVLEEVNDQLLAQIGAQRATEAALRDSEERFQKAFQISPIGLMIVTGDTGLVVEANACMLEMFGVRREEMLGQTLAELERWAPDGEIAGLFDMLRTDNSLHEIETHLYTRSGEMRDIVTSIEPIELRGQACLLTLCLDISARKQIEAQLIQAQKMEGIGRLAGGVAHDFNNLLTIMTGNLDLAIEALPSGHPAREELLAVQDTTVRAASLTRQLLAFARKQTLAPRVQPLNDIVRNAERLLQRVAGDSVRLEVALGADVGLVRADAGQIEQVLINMLANARDAMPDGGVVRITTASVDLESDVARGTPGGSPGPNVVIAVSDTGAGMSPEVQARLFEPFFTTKAIGKGTGLGLATSYGIIRQHGGSIACTSEPGAGTTFRIFLPRAAQRQPPQLAPADEGAGRQAQSA